ncbi:MAG: HypC/HybG/HupF family hydrogenase formation chaperone [Coriobacteriales bacterium]|jgi:hydrogenase expression/formation protein HypC|nr:HypC/HybG/HupF family hydrogenase formation chaperone [Coriobacteriales bacterium]
MCLAIPAKILSVDEGRIASVSILGVSRLAALDLVPQATLGDYVLVHAGYAIEVIDEAMARETLDLIAQFPELAGQAYG